MTGAGDDQRQRPALPWYGFVVASFVACLLASGLNVVFIPENWPLLLYPVIVAALPTWLRGRRWPRVCATVLLAPLATFIFSIGPFYVPGMVLMAIAAMAPPPIDWDAAYAEAQSDSV